MAAIFEKENPWKSNFFNTGPYGDYKLAEMTPRAKISWPCDFLVASENAIKYTDKIHVL